jgi:hypothetical protein
LNTELNSCITEKDVLNAVKCLKNNKVCGSDLILNDFLKHSCSKLLPVFVKLFNVVFDSSIIPDYWSEGIFFFCRAKREFFFQNLTLGYMKKTLNQIIFFPSTKIRIFFSATLGIRIFFLEKNHNPPFKLNDRSPSLFAITKQ